MGVVYLLTNAMMPRCVKIGSTVGCPHARAAALSAATGVPAPFEVALYAETDEWRMQEAEIHDMLSPWRLPRREFFVADRAGFAHVLDAFAAQLGWPALTVVDQVFFARHAWEAAA